ncbi:hypothetical protein BC826DRAFT_1189625 [Russula brevipes]|nr:hypothetical protein BC826DRAFT_1189625 [Russula brevipes]
MLPGYTIPQRIEALERWEAAWRNLEAQSSFQVKRIVACELAGIGCCTYIMRDDFLIATHGSGIDPGYGYIDLRVFQPGEETDPWTRIRIDNWSGKHYLLRFFPEQDLVVAIFWSTDNSLIEIHGFSFSQGTPHPRFVSATITTAKNPESVYVTIIGNHTILHASLRKSQRLFLHSWKDGRVSQLRDAPQRTWSKYCAVLSHDTIALLEDFTATLEVCRIVQESDRDTPSLRTLIPVHSDTHSFVVGVPGRPPRRHPFHNSAEERIIAIAFHIGLSDHFTIVTHDWGPSGTACFDRHINITGGVCAGERLATISDRSLSLFDFNSARVQNAIREVGRPSQNAAHSVVKDRVVIPRGESFEMDVVSELPYISVVIPTPRNWKSLRNYEEGLVGFSNDIHGEARDHVNIYTIR